MTTGAGKIIWKGAEIPALLPGLEFFEDGHVYKVNGAVWKSVTQYTKLISNHDFVTEIDADYAKTTSKLDKEYNAKKAQLDALVHLNFGSVVHDYLYKDDMDILDFNSPEFDHRFDGYIAGWNAECVKRGWDRKKMLAEYPLYSKKYLYAGRLDNLFETEKYDWLIDKKTGQPSPTTGPQLAGYGQAAIEWGLTTLGRLRLLEVCIDKNGVVKTQPFDFKSCLQDFLMAYSLTNKYKK